jgi:hypothetical protein
MNKQLANIGVEYPVSDVVISENSYAKLHNLLRHKDWIKHIKSVALEKPGVNEHWFNQMEDACQQALRTYLPGFLHEEDWARRRND